MSNDTLEQQELKCSVTLTGSKYSSATACTFVFLHGEEELGRQEATVADGAGECAWTPPAVADVAAGALSYVAHYTIEVGGQPHEGFDEQVTVWA